jgi:hypothetical protein
MAKSSGRDGCRGQPKRCFPARGSGTYCFAFAMARLCRRCSSHSIAAPLALVRAGPQPVDQHQNILEHLPRHCDLSQRVIQKWRHLRREHRSPSRIHRPARHLLRGRRRAIPIERIALRRSGLRLGSDYGHPGAMNGTDRAPVSLRAKAMVLTRSP